MFNLTSSLVLSALRMHGIENPSPALSLDLVVGNDSDGWPVYRQFVAGSRMVSQSGKLYKVVGFTRDDLVVVVQAGLEIDPAISSVTFEPEGLDFLKGTSLEASRHKEGLVWLGAA
ncbi:MAG: hypothetical protein GY841_10175 [FCB group bacterium]|nr:hypothetical protein [FCB group bacterium]